MTADEQPKDTDKGPSKKELKKLAKKAEKDAAKKSAKGGSNDGGGGDSKAQGATAAATADNGAPPPPPPPRLALRVRCTNDEDGATLKSCAGAIAHGVELIPAWRAGSWAGSNGTDGAGEDFPFAHGPVLLLGGGAGGAPAAAAFGGNGILRALASLRNGGGPPSAAEDDWLEFERCELRPALAGGAGSSIRDVALSKVEAALALNGGTSVVSVDRVGGSTSVADISVSVALLHTSGSMKLPPTVEAYLDVFRKSEVYAEAQALAESMVPPPPPAPFDPTDPSLIRATESIFAGAVLSAFPSAVAICGVDIYHSFKCKDIKHGDYQCNAAMKLFQKLKAAGALPSGVNRPQDVAQKIIDAVPGDNPVVTDFVVNGPGFIMCRVKAPYLEKFVNAVVSNGAPSKPKCAAVTGNSSVVVDFSSPNIAKEMHVGHLRSTIIGETVCRVLEYVGNDVKRVNHVGDWGTQFGMLIQYLKEEYPNFQNDVPNITGLTVFYKNAKQRFDLDPDFKKTSQMNVVKLQAGDEECRKIWQILCDVSRKEFQKVYERLDISVEECGESFYNARIPPVIQEFEERGMISVEEGGAKCVFVPKFKIPLMLQKSDGGYGYDSTDMAALKYRLCDLNARQIIYVTDFSQGDHFQMCFAAANKIGWIEDGTHRLDHIGFGTVMGEDGKRFKTRSGDTVRLVDLLDEAVLRMASSLRERIAEGKANIVEDEVSATAAAIGYGAVKYFDLRRNPTSNYVFSYDRMLDTKGNTAVYLLYAHARLESIISKGTDVHGVNIDALIKEGRVKIALGHKSERNLALHLQFYSDAVEETLNDLFPYHVCDFLYALSIAASEFVTQCKVLGSPEMESRLLLCRATAITMRKCFDLLGIRHVMRI